MSRTKLLSRETPALGLYVAFANSVSLQAPFTISVVISALLGLDLDREASCEALEPMETRLNSTLQ